MPNEDFAYEQLVNHLKGPEHSIDSTDGNVTAYIDYDYRSGQIKDFFILSYIGRDIGRPNFSEDKGWKFHISLDDEVGGNISIGWNILKDVLIANKVRMAKVVKPNVMMADDPEQCGKQVTIYTWCNPEKSLGDWVGMIAHITTSFVQHDVIPGYKCVGSDFLEDFNFPGNNYFTRRYQKSATERGRGLLSMRVEESVIDPYINVTFNIPGQRAPKLFQAPHVSTSVGLS